MCDFDFDCLKLSNQADEMAFNKKGAKASASSWKPKPMDFNIRYILPNGTDTLPQVAIPHLRFPFGVSERDRESVDRNGKRQASLSFQGKNADNQAELDVFFENLEARIHTLILEYLVMKMGTKTATTKMRELLSPTNFSSMCIKSKNPDYPANSYRAKVLQERIFKDRKPTNEYRYDVAITIRPCGGGDPMRCTVDECLDNRLLNGVNGVVCLAIRSIWQGVEAGCHTIESILDNARKPRVGVRMSVMNIVAKQSSKSKMAVSEENENKMLTMLSSDSESDDETQSVADDVPAKATRGKRHVRNVVVSSDSECAE